MSEFKYTFNLDTTASGDGAEKTKAGIDAVTQSKNQAAEAQVKASSDVADALKEEFAALDELGKRAAERTAQTKNAVEETEAHIEQLETLVDAVNRYNDALAAGDQEATIEALGEIKQGMDAMAESSDEIPPELEEINAELDELDKKVRGKKSFEKLSDQANGTSKSLKRIEKLQVAEAIGNIVQQARSAGKSFADLGKEGESATDTALNAAGAVGDLASGVAAGFAAGGPIGAGIALVTAGLSYFSEEAKKTRAEIDKAFGGDIELKFKQTESSIKASADAAKAYSDQIAAGNAELDSQAAKLENIHNLELQRARNKAALANKELDLEKLDIIGSDLGEKEKAKELARITKQQIENEANFKEKEIRSAIASDQKKIENLRAKVLKLEGQVNDKAKSLFTDNIANGNEADSLESAANRQGDRFEDAAKNIPELLDYSVTNPFYDEAHQDELKKYVKEINEQKSTDDPKQRVEAFQRLKNILESAPVGDLDSHDKKLLVGLNKVIKEYAEFQKINIRASKSRQKANDFDDELKKDRDELKKAKERLDQNDERLEGQIALNNDRLDDLESNTSLDKRAVDKRTDNKVNQINKRDAQKAAQQEKKRQREAEKKQKEQEREQKKEDAEIKKAASLATGVAKDKDIGLNSSQINHVEKAQASLQDGVDLSEVKTLQKIVIDLANEVIKTQGKNSAEFEQLKQANRMLSGKVKLIEQRNKVDR